MLILKNYYITNGQARHQPSVHCQWTVYTYLALAADQNPQHPAQKHEDKQNLL